MASLERWRSAQTYEQAYWQKRADRIADGSAHQMDWYGWKAAEMERRLAPHASAHPKQTAKILEIGSGPIGIVSFLKWGERYTLDPPENFYKSNAALCHLRDAGVHYGQGTGEQIPFDDGTFSLVILDNVLDHVHQASGVLEDIHRVLASDGILYLVVNVHPPWGGFLHTILSRLKIDRGHPYTFTVARIRAFIARHRFHIRANDYEDYLHARHKDRTSPSLKDKLKGYSGLSEFIYYSVSTKSPSPYEGGR